MSPRTNPHWSSLVVIGCALTLLAGCTSGKSESWKFAQGWDASKMMWWKSDEPAPPQKPTRLVTTWTQTIHHRSDQPPERGFGGRVVFFNDESESPIRVEGQLVVYAFDESDRASHETQPTRRFIFPPEQFVRHESESKLGPSYSVWLPWDKVGGERKNISLIARFEPVGGSLIVGEQTRHLLPGSLSEETRKTLMAGKQAASEIQLAGYENEAESKQEPEKPQMSTATFSLPQRLGKSLATNAAPVKKSPQQQLSAPSLWPASKASIASAPNDSPSASPDRKSLRSRSLKDSLLGTLPAQ